MRPPLQDMYLGCGVNLYSPQETNELLKTSLESAKDDFLKKANEMPGSVATIMRDSVKKELKAELISELRKDMRIPPPIETAKPTGLIAYIAAGLITALAAVGGGYYLGRKSVVASR